MTLTIVESGKQQDDDDADADNADDVVDADDVDDVDDIYIMMKCVFVCNEKWALPPGSLL